jgi:hypothetical protein
MSGKTHVKAAGDADTPASDDYPATKPPTVVTEEHIIDVEPWENGSGPTWDYGSRNIVRIGNSVFVSISTPDPDSPAYRNVFWNLFRRVDGGAWEHVADAGEEREREPCPVVAMPDGRLALSTTPAIETTGENDEGIVTTRNEPRILLFDATNPGSPPDTLMPAWRHTIEAFEHSYRGFAVDGQSGGMFITQQVHDGSKYGRDQEWAYRGISDEWETSGQLSFPMRGCYPNIAVYGTTVHILAISDEGEPNSEWRDYKRNVTGQQWDYDFRQLYYTWTPDVTECEFSPPITVASHDETAGFISNCDIWIESESVAHVIYTELNVWHDFMRDKFFPGLPIYTSLKVATLTQGRVTRRRTLVHSVEDPSAVGNALTFDGPVPTWAVFHSTPDGRLFAIWNQSGADAGMYIQRLLPDADTGPVRIETEHPLGRFFNAAERAGCEPSHTVDILGHPASGPDVMRYLQFTIE